MEDNTTTTTSPKTLIEKEISEIIVDKIEKHNNIVLDELQKIEDNFDLNLDDLDEDLEKLSDEERQFKEIHKTVLTSEEKLEEIFVLTEQRTDVQFKALSKIIELFEKQNSKIIDFELTITNSIKEETQAIKEENQKEILKLYEKLETLEKKSSKTPVIFSMFIFNLVTIVSIIAYLKFFN